MSGDQPLIEAFQSGDEFAFVSLYNRYKGPVYAFCVKMLSDREVAADVMQDTFLRLYEHRDRLMKTSSFKSWLFTIARNQCLNTMRRDRRLVGMGDHIAELEADSTPIQHMEKSERIALVGAFLMKLSPDYREVLILREYQNLSYEEIAAVTRSTVSAVKSRLFKARRKLAKLMQPVLAEPIPKGASARRAEA
ncbi:MAG: RNA polymerase sigma factor [Rhodothermales bacterium]|nr:RNA polymerase sigma factor [Rhodothermales bacterium]MBO6781644.1 RNA polymerase sigma factor [Rhodothermales bacterium]